MAPAVVRMVVDPLRAGGRVDRPRHEDLSERDSVVSGCGTVREEDDVAGRACREFAVELSDRHIGLGLRTAVAVLPTGGRRS